MTHQNVCRWHFSPSVARSLRAECVNYLLCAVHKFWELRTDTCFNTDCSVEAHGILRSPWTASVWGTACGTDLLRLTPAHSGLPSSSAALALSVPCPLGTRTTAPWPPPQPRPHWRLHSGSMAGERDHVKVRARHGFS